MEKEMTNCEATHGQIQESTVVPTTAPSPRFLLLPRASGSRVLPALPSLPSSPRLLLDGGIQARFDGWADCTDLWRWRLWVAKLRALHEPLWRELGILEGILATTYRVRRGVDGGAALLQLVPFWSSPTNTFVFPWGEATVTLEDVAALAGLPLVGLPVREPPYRRGSLDMAVSSVLQMIQSDQGTWSWWVEQFLRQQQRPEEAMATAASAGGREDQLFEHSAFLALWLARFVLPAEPSVAGSGIIVKAEELSPIAVRLARGKSVALAPAVLAKIYCDLSALHRHFVYSKRTEALSVSAPMHILQLWVWERFPELRPAMASIPDPSAHGDVPRAARWHDVHKALEPGYVHAVLKAPKEFEWRPYGNSYLVRGHHGHDAAAGNRPLRLSFARCLHACELVGMDEVEQYNPHRVARQLGFDQDIPGMVTRLNTTFWEKAWETYIIDANESVIPTPNDRPGVTEEYAEWWRPYSASSGAIAAIHETDNMEKWTRA